jgi:Zn-dependent protease
VSEAPTTRPCPGCGSELVESLLVCPGCGRLVHREELERLAGEAERAQAAGELATARRLWRQAHERLPPASRQSQAVAERIAGLNRQLEDGPEEGETPRPAWVKALGPLGVVFFFVLTKGKLLALGLTKSGTLLSMLASLGVYWTAWGWRFALGLVASLYVHEMGHVAALRRYGVEATAPMFLPGVGAVVRLKQRLADPVEEARVGLAGPVWGLGAALVCVAVHAATGSGIWAAIARVGAWLNLFNLLPLGPLDGGRGFTALSPAQRLAVAFVIGVAWAVTRDGLLILLGLVAVGRALFGRAPEHGDPRTAWEFCALVAALAAVTLLPVPGMGHLP